MAIAFRSNTKADLSGPASLSITAPSGLASTDVMILCIATGATTGSSSNTAATWTAPGGGGWTQLTGSPWAYVVTADAASNMQFFWALGSVSLPATFSKSGGTGTQFVGWINASFTGVDNTTPIEVIGTEHDSGQTSGSSVTANQITTTDDACLELIGCTDTQDGVFSNASFNALDNGHTNQTCDLLYGKSAISPAGSAGPFTISNTKSSNFMMTVPIAIKPAGASTAVISPAVYLAGRQAVIGTGIFKKENNIDYEGILRHKLIGKSRRGRSQLVKSTRSRKLALSRN